jgi:hypothetical protein
MQPVKVTAPFLPFVKERRTYSYSRTLTVVQCVSLQLNGSLNTIVGPNELPHFLVKCTEESVFKTSQAYYLVAGDLSGFIYVKSNPTSIYLSSISHSQLTTDDLKAIKRSLEGFLAYAV